MVTQKPCKRYINGPACYQREKQRPKQGRFDSQATFTPNILYANGKYYLYYTGVKPTPENEKGEFENNSTTDITAIGVAVSDSPDGPFARVTEEPILKVSVESEKFDSYRVDDASLPIA